MEVLESLSHTKLLIILAVCLVPALLQAFIGRAVHWLWLFVAILAAIFVVTLW